MSTFEVPVLRIDDVYDHPNADRLSIIKVRGYEAITNKLDGAHRFEKGEVVIYVPEGAVVPEQHLRARGYWNHEKDVGMLAGSKGDRVKALSLRGVLSQGLVWKVRDDLCEGQVWAADNGASACRVVPGDDVAEFFGITKYVPQIPTSMDGLMFAEFESRLDYDIENIKAFPDLFSEGEQVVVTEKLHGTLARLTYVPELTPNPELFGDGRCVIATKGMGAQGLSFLNVEKNRTNLYVQQLAPLAAEFTAFCDTRFPGYTVHLIGEVFGPGVQDLHYGLDSKALRVFDIALTADGQTTYLDEEMKVDTITRLGLSRVPVLYMGPFSMAKMDELVSGSTTVSRNFGGGEGPHIREGIVITAEGNQGKRETGLGARLRPILKHVSGAYLTRRGGTEYQ
jgi:RNA ligase (TIGR02306 family)